MKKQKIRYVIIGLLTLLLISLAALIIDVQGKGEKEETEMKLVLYEGPVSLPDTPADDPQFAPETQRDSSLMHCIDTQITVDGQECYVYDTLVNHSRSWNNNYLPSLSRTPITYFDFEGRADIVITVPKQELESVVIRPSSYGITPVVDRNAHTVSFSISEPDTYTVEFNGSPLGAIHIFANSLEADVPDFEDENVIYIGPGEWDIESINLESGQTLYLAGGAVVHGTVNGLFTSNIKIMGRGIIDGSRFEGWKGKNAHIPLKFDNSKNVEIKDVIVLNSNAWVCQCYSSKQVTIDGLKIISARPNGDGISIQSCEDVQVANCFVRTWDDSLVVKNYRSSSRNIHFAHMQLWTDLAQSMEIGYETNKGSIKDAEICDVTFSDICVLHNYHKPVISIHNADDAEVYDITFENITVEDCEVGSGDGMEMPYLIDMHIAQNSNWSTTKERGTIHDVWIDGVKVLEGKMVPSRVQGYDLEHTIFNVTFHNMEWFGMPVETPEDGEIQIDEKTTANIQVVSEK